MKLVEDSRVDKHDIIDIVVNYIKYIKMKLFLLEMKEFRTALRACSQRTKEWDTVIQENNPYYYIKVDSILIKEQGNLGNMLIDKLKEYCYCENTYNEIKEKIEENNQLRLFFLD